MSWLYVPGLEASNLESELPNPERAASVTLKGKPMRPQSLRRAWKMGGYIRRLSGLILEPSILRLGAESWIASLRAIPANPIASPESNLEKMMIDGCSIASYLSLKPSGRIVSSAKTSLGIPMGNLKPSSRHWKEWAIALRQEYSARKKLAEAIGANGCSSWLSPRAGDVAAGESNETFIKRMGDRTDRCFGSLAAQAVRGGETWPTPQAIDSNGQGRPGRLKKDGNRNPNLPGSYRRDLKDSACRFSLHAQPIPDGRASSKSTRRLNPLFVEWLMGWPIGWTGCAPVEMACSQWLPLMRGYLWMLLSARDDAQQPDLFG